MDEKKIAFIICSHQEAELAEVLFYIDRQKIPDGFFYEVFVVNHAKGMADGYQQAMLLSDAKYKIYLHEDVFLIHERAICELIMLFQTNPKYHMLGVLGTLKLTDDGTLLAKKEDNVQIGYIYGIYDDVMDSKRAWSSEYENVRIAPVAAIDGIFIATCADINWRSDIFDGWHYYDLSQSIEFNKRGLKVGCINVKMPWIIHRSDRQTAGLSFEKYRMLFLKEYAEVLSDYTI